MDSCMYSPDSSVRVHFNPLRDIRKPIYDFLKDFAAQSETTFDKFCTMWNNNRIWLIICGKGTIERFIDTLGCVFFHLIDYFMENDNDSFDEAKIGVLYLLYAFYFLQPPFYKIRIRVCPSSWKKITTFADQLEKNSVYQPYYIFNKLVALCAFEFCLTRQPLFPVAPLFNDPDNCEASQVKRSRSTYIHAHEKCAELHEKLEKLMNPIGTALNQYVDIKSSIYPHINRPKSSKREEAECSLKPLTASQYFSDSEGSSDSISSDDQEFCMSGLNYIEKDIHVQRLTSLIERLPNSRSGGVLDSRKFNKNSIKNHKS